MNQAERDAKVRRAFLSYRQDRTTADEQGRRVQKPFAEQWALWEAMWAAADFSWEALADAGWERADDDANEAQKLKRWRAPADFPLDVPVQGEGEKAFKPATLQDYWRWVPNDPSSFKLGAEAGEVQFGDGAQGERLPSGEEAAERYRFGAGRLASDDELKALGLLVEVEGRLWHALHRAELQMVSSPVHGGGGSPQSGETEGAALGPPSAAARPLPPQARGETSTGAALTAAMLQRLALAKSGFNAQLTGARAQGLDAVWRAFAGSAGAKRPLYLSASLAAFDSCDARGLSFAEANFEEASFAAEANFRESSFLADALFSRVSFAAIADFREASFAAEAKFERANFAAQALFFQASFAAEAYFLLASFAGQGGFSKASFAGEANFLEASFAGEASFGSANFAAKADFFQSNFAGSANFIQASFACEANFWGANFAAYADFRQARFAAEAEFGYASFGAEANYERASFAAEAKFRAASFAGEAKFEQASFAAAANFDRASFAAEASFDQARFAAEADFGSATFAGTLSASGLICNGRFEMRAAEVKGYADFSGATWPTKLEDQHAAFEGCRFRDVADFKTEGFSAFALFDGAEFKGRVLLSDPGEAGENALFAVARQAAQAAVAADRQAKQDFAKAQRAHQQALAAWEREEAQKPEKERAEKPEAPQALAFADERGPDKRFAALAGGLRTLKLAMAAQSDINREQRFYRYEIQARTRMPAEPWPAKLAAAIYGAASDYGASVGRPFVALAVVLAVFSAGYWGWAYQLGLPAAALTPQSAAQAMEFSLTNTFRPLSALSAEGLREDTLGVQLLAANDFAALGVRALSIIQSLSAIILAFLFGLAVRRRFQIA